MKALKSSKTHDNLKTAFAGESQANRRYLYFARRADIEGYPDVGGLFRDTSEAERPDTRSDTSTSRRKWAIRSPACRSATPRRISSRRSRARPTSTRRCTRGSPRPRVTRLRRDRRVVRDPGAGGEVARRALPEGPRRPQPVTTVGRGSRVPGHDRSSDEFVDPPGDAGRRRRPGALRGGARRGTPAHHRARARGACRSVPTSPLYSRTTIRCTFRSRRCCAPSASPIWMPYAPSCRCTMPCCPNRVS